MSFKPGPRKKISKVKVFDDLEGEHQVSPDGSHVSIGGATFKRTILPSVASPQREDAQLNDELESMTNQSLEKKRQIAKACVVSPALISFCALPPPSLSEE